VTRAGQPTAFRVITSAVASWSDLQRLFVLISHDDLESLEETLSILSDPALMEQIHESEQALADGAQATTLAELRAGLENRRNAAA